MCVGQDIPGLLKVINRNSRCLEGVKMALNNTSAVIKLDCKYCSMETQPCYYSSLKGTNETLALR